MASPAPIPPGALVAAFVSTAMIAQQVAGKAARDALFLSSFHVTSLPWMMAGSAVLSLFAVLWLSRLFVRHSPFRVLPFLFAASGAALLAEWALSFSTPRTAAIALYLHTGVFGASVISGFWSVINERYDPHAGKRAVSWISAGGTLGGVIGGLSAWRAASVIEVPTMLPLLAGLNLLCCWGTLRLKDPNARSSATPRVSQGAGSGALGALRPLSEMPYLRNLALVVALGAVTSGLLDYVFSAEATKALTKGPQLLSFFALFWLSVGVVSFGLQLLLGRIVLDKLGLALTIALLPGGVVLGGALGLAVPGLWTAAIVRGGEAAQRNSWFRSAYEMLYTPLSEDTKRSTKALIDVGFDRLGTVAASGIVMLTIQAEPARTTAILMSLGIAFALVTAARSRPLHMGYVAVLADSLRKAADRHEEALETPLQASMGVIEPNLTSTQIGAVRDAVIAQLEVLPSTTELAVAAGEPGTSEHVIVRLDEPAVASEERLAILDATLDALADMRSGDAARVRRVLSAQAPLALPLVPFALLFLADEAFHLDALRALRTAAPRATGQLLDALCDGNVAYDIRRRIPRVLAECPTQVAADGLIRGTDSDRFEVRYQCGRALLKITGVNKDIVIVRETVLAMVRREVERSAEVWESQSPSGDDDDENDAPSLIDRLLRDRIDRSLEHVFTLLALHLDRDALRTAFKALHRDEPRLRGTALEYLETVLPVEIRDAVWPFLGEERPMRAARPPQEILDDLVRAREAPVAPSQVPSAAAT